MRRHPLPRLWLMTDERQGERLWPALNALPPGSGVIVRHYGLRPAERRALIGRIRRLSRRRRLVLVVGGSEQEARAARADGFHGRSRKPAGRTMLRTAPVHSRRELQQAIEARADLVFVSPVFATQSHPGAKPLGQARFGMLARQSPVPVIALGGMTRRRAQSLRSLKIHGWAAIGALTPKD